MLNKKDYIASKAWEQNPYLTVLANGTATKICLRCKRKQFTTEFMDVEIDVWHYDGKESICFDCKQRGAKSPVSGATYVTQSWSSENPENGMAAICEPCGGV